MLSRLVGTLACMLIFTSGVAAQPFPGDIASCNTSLDTLKDQVTALKTKYSNDRAEFKSDELAKRQECSEDRRKANSIKDPSDKATAMGVYAKCQEDLSAMRDLHRDTLADERNDISEAKGNVNAKKSECRDLQNTYKRNCSDLKRSVTSAKSVVNSDRGSIRSRQGAYDGAVRRRKGIVDRFAAQIKAIDKILTINLVQEGVQCGVKYGLFHAILDGGLLLQQCLENVANKVAKAEENKARIRSNRDIQVANADVNVSLAQGRINEAQEKLAGDLATLDGARKAYYTAGQCPPDATVDAAL